MSLYLDTPMMLWLVWLIVGAVVAVTIDFGLKLAFPIGGTVFILGVFLFTIYLWRSSKKTEDTE